MSPTEHEHDIYVVGAFPPEPEKEPDPEASKARYDSLGLRDPTIIVTNCSICRMYAGTYIVEATRLRLMPEEA